MLAFTKKPVLLFYRHSRKNKTYSRALEPQFCSICVFIDASFLIEKFSVSYCSLITYSSSSFCLFISLFFLSVSVKIFWYKEFQESERKTDFIEPGKRGERRHGNSNNCTFINKSKRCFL